MEEKILLQVTRVDDEETGKVHVETTVAPEGLEKEMLPEVLAQLINSAEKRYGWDAQKPTPKRTRKDRKMAKPARQRYELSMYLFLRPDTAAVDMCHITHAMSEAIRDMDARISDIRCYRREKGTAYTHRED